MIGRSINMRGGNRVVLRDDSDNDSDDEETSLLGKVSNARGKT